jgi:hypothetical protein
MNDEQEVELKLSLKRERVERLIAMLEVKRANGGLSDNEIKAYEVATLRLYGAGASPKKFARLEAQQVDGVLRGNTASAAAFRLAACLVAELRFRIWRATSSAMMVPPKRRLST